MISRPSSIADPEPGAYPGRELEVFAAARNWKRYLSEMVRPYLGRRVAEVGAGLGATTEYLCSARQESWLCIEPDESLGRQIAYKIKEGVLPSCCRLHMGSLHEIPAEDMFDTLVYIDVLEHIEDDRQELARAEAHLEKGGTLIVLSPSHQWLYSEFDRAIGHFRRYNRIGLVSLAPLNLELISARYLDSVGLLASMANRFVLRHSHPSQGSINIWDKGLVPLSRLLDPLTGYTLGKSVLAVWRKKV